MELCYKKHLRNLVLNDSKNRWSIGNCSHLQKTLVMHLRSDFPLGRNTARPPILTGSVISGGRSAGQGEARGDTRGMWWGSNRQHISKTLLFLRGTRMLSIIPDHNPSLRSSKIDAHKKEIHRCFCNCSSPLSTHALMDLNYSPSRKSVSPAAEHTTLAPNPGARYWNWLETARKQPARAKTIALTCRRFVSSVAVLRPFLSLVPLHHKEQNILGLLPSFHLFLW